MSETIQPFRIDIPQADLDDVQDRLARTRWPKEIGDNGDWQAGTNLAYVRELVDYWLKQYDWRRQEAAMNLLPQFRTTIDNVPIHFIHVKGKGPSPIPLIINHGWPCTYVSSARHYYEAKPERLAPCHDRQPPVEAPTALLQFKGDVWLQPRKWAERYYNLKRWSVAEKGGHFAPMEMPELLVDDLRQFFRTLRNDID